MLRYSGICDILTTRVGGHLVGENWLSIENKPINHLLFESEHLLIIYLTNLA